MPDTEREAVQQFDAARQAFLHAVDAWLAAAAVSPEDRASEIAATRRVLNDKLRLMGW